jgi:RHS repeat-associated protein
MCRCGFCFKYGEVFIEERNGTWNTPYLFNGKELDEETGLYYYGARYLNPTSGMWLSTDPLFEKYVGMSPYNYCAGNPVKLVDVDGREISDEESMKDAQHLKMCARLNSMLLERKLNDEGVDKEDLQSRILEFKQTMQDIDDMIADKKHDYKFQKVSENDGNVTIAKDEKNILISYNSVGTRAHEARHGGQIARGEMTVSKNGDGSFGFLNYSVNKEVDAYRAQVAFDGSFTTYSYGKYNEYVKNGYNFPYSSSFYKKTVSQIKDVNNDFVKDIMYLNDKNVGTLLYNF